MQYKKGRPFADGPEQDNSCLNFCKYGLNASCLGDNKGIGFVFGKRFTALRPFHKLVACLGRSLQLARFAVIDAARARYAAESGAVYGNRYLHLRRRADGFKFDLIFGGIALRHGVFIAVDGELSAFRKTVFIDLQRGIRDGCGCQRTAA